MSARTRTRNLEIVDDRVGVTVVPEDGVERLDPVPVFRAYAGHDEVDVVVPGVRDGLDGVVVRIDFAPCNCKIVSPDSPQHHRVFHVL